ncbi:MAG: flagellar biosynthesis protein FlhA, partial [Caldimonas sp.]
MNEVFQSLQARLGPNAKAVRALMAPLVVVMILAMMVLPLPPLALDLLFTFNIAMALMVMMVAAYMVRPLDFAAFPAVILLTTLLRLSLNVASTRVVLLEGHTGAGAAGKVIESFGHFLIGGNFAVGLIVFAILVVINFVVVTKGAERIAEVGARFTLDAMPGKQMAIDADLNSGLIDEEQARRRRSEVHAEADFYGSMDGASKFVKGDAIAAIVITLVNLIGGFAVGVAQNGMSMTDAVQTYSLLSIGDGLVSQIPALLLSVATGLIVTRATGEDDMGSDIVRQLGRQQTPLRVAGFAALALCAIPGMPKLPFMIAGGLMLLASSRVGRDEDLVEETGPVLALGNEHETPEDLAIEIQVDPLALDLSADIIDLVD